MNQNYYKTDNNIIAVLLQKGLTPEEAQAEYELYMQGKGTVVTKEDERGILIEMEWGD